MPLWKKLPFLRTFEAQRAQNGSKKEKHLLFIKISLNSILQPSKGWHYQVVKITAPYSTLD
jgi:hypothetical protein